MSIAREGGIRSRRACRDTIASNRSGYAYSGMDPLTHLLYGATLARTGLNRKAAYTTVAMTLAAETPDIDVLWGFGGPVAAFQHHRGMTHTFIGLPFEAAVVISVVYLVHRIRVRRSYSRGASSWGGATAPTLTHAPVRWGLLYCFALIALLSHLFLDWTNNYGIRPFFPFNPRWYQLSTVFIVEPLILLFLFAALLAPPLFGLIAGEVGARRKRFRGRGWAVFALVAIAALWGLRQIEHDSATDLAAAAPYGPAGNPVSPDQVLRVAASPAPVNPFVWHTVAETPEFYQIATVDILRHMVDSDPAHELLYKPPATAATLVAKQSALGRAYLDWSSWPLVSDLGPSALPTADAQAPASFPTMSGKGSAEPTKVLFRDLRFLYNAPTIDWHQNPPLSGQVFVDLTKPEASRIAGMYMNGRSQR